jgi:toxin CcdB
VAQFEVFRLRDGGDLLIDCQSDLLRHLNSRFVVPLMPLEYAPAPAARLNPLFEVEGQTHSMVTQFASSVPSSELREVVCTLKDRGFEIVGAIDTLMGGV